MGVLVFSDGISVDTSGDWRLLKLQDGVYVAGWNSLIPCQDEEEANQLLKTLKEDSQQLADFGEELIET